MLLHCDQMILGGTRALITKVPFGQLDISSNASMECQYFSVCVPMHGMQAYQITWVASILSCSCMPTSYDPKYISQTAYKSYSIILPAVDILYISKIIWNVKFFNKENMIQKLFPLPSNCIHIIHFKNH